MEHIVTEEYISSLLSEISSEVQEFQKSRSPGYRTGHESYLRWIEHMGTLEEWVYAQYTNVIFTVRIQSIFSPEGLETIDPL